MIGKSDNLKNTERKNTDFGFYLDKRWLSLFVNVWDILIIIIIISLDGSQSSLDCA